MIELEFESGFAMFLKHNELINNAYKMYENTSKKCYKLKSDIFYYTEKKSSNSDKKIKRKRKLKESADIDLNDLKEIENLKEITEDLIKRCQELNLFSLSTKIENNFSSNEFHNDFHKFPIFKGENQLNEFIITNLNNSDYIIPPKCRFFNHNIENLHTTISNEKFDLIIMDPPWWNKYIRRLKMVQKNLGYEMLSNDIIENIPIMELTNEQSIIAIWCTNHKSHHKMILENILTKWKCKLVTICTWIKLNNFGSLICDFRMPTQKQPFEKLFILCRDENEMHMKFPNILLSIPSVIHSHKPPLFELFKKYLPEEPKCLELFARYLYPNFTSIGLEVIRLQDKSLYNCEINDQNQSSV